ncbi:MAG TPA: nucleotide exchange factor GrpE [Phycisphaerae bacterium]|nr:nucleotide exchange factor GrpE [Phycisphaerae bacterium]HUU21527.1 nucleotide exchange factor GrpE [Phycisphaerae bacterium]
MAKRRDDECEGPEGFTGRDEAAEPSAREGDVPEEAPIPAAPEDIAALKSERDDLLSRLQRVSADYLNYQQRARRDLEAATDYANADLIRDILAVLDDMERALEAGATNHAPDDPLLAGMRLVYDKALEVLARYGLRPIEAVGQPFDPTRHEALMQQPSDQHEGEIVLSELQRGYQLKGRVLRPARVIVSAPPAGAPEPGGK